MSEIASSPEQGELGEKEKYFDVYYGTTLENFFKCAKVDEHGNVAFEKQQEKRHVEPEATQFVKGLIGGAGYVFLRAKELGHTPLILQGKLDRQKYLLRQELFPGEPFPVQRVWVPKEGVDWKSYNRFADNFDVEGKETRRVFEAKNPVAILKPPKGSAA